MEALLKAAEDPDYPADFTCVIANKASAAGLEIAKAYGVKTHVIPHKNYKTREEFDDALNEVLRAQKIEFVALAGFMRVLTEGFVQKWQGRMVNIHPSLLPLFPGLKTHERALEAGVRFHGVTVHYVTSGVDEGPIIGQGMVGIDFDDTAETLAKKLLPVEHSLYPSAFARIVSGGVVFESGDAIVKTRAKTPDFRLDDALLSIR